MNMATGNLAQTDLTLEASTGFARARLGLIIPSSNRLSEPHFRRFMPRDVGVHTTRLRMTGAHNKPLDQLLEDVSRAAATLGDARCDVIVFHCTANSMEHGLEGEQKILDAVRESSGAQALSTAQGVVEALRASAMKKMVLISPYPQSHNDHEKEYLEALGFQILHDVALGAPSVNYPHVPPSKWMEVARAHWRDDADGIFLSCTNTTQIDIIAPLEAELGKPVVNSNQATIWASLKRLAPKLGPTTPPAALGSLMGR